MSDDLSLTPLSSRLDNTDSALRGSLFHRTVPKVRVPLVSSPHFQLLMLRFSAWLISHPGYHCGKRSLFIPDLPSFDTNTPASSLVHDLDPATRPDDLSRSPPSKHHLVLPLESPPSSPLPPVESPATSTPSRSCADPSNGSTHVNSCYLAAKSSTSHRVVSNGIETCRCIDEASVKIHFKQVVEPLYMRIFPRRCKVSQLAHGKRPLVTEKRGRQ